MTREFIQSILTDHDGNIVRAHYNSIKDFLSYYPTVEKQIFRHKKYKRVHTIYHIIKKEREQ